MLLNATAPHASAAHASAFGLLAVEPEPDELVLRGPLTSQLVTAALTTTPVDTGLRTTMVDTALTTAPEE